MVNPRNSRTFRDGSRIYTWHGERFPSVTTILNVLPKHALVNWAALRVAEFAYDEQQQWSGLARGAAVDLLKRSPYREKSNAADIGSAVHSAVEAHILGTLDTVGFPAGVDAWVQAFFRFVEEFQPTFEMSEATVYNRQFGGYAGTLDIIATFPDGRRGLLDVKSGKGVYPDYSLQLSAYKNAEFVGLPDGTEAPLPKCDFAAVLHLRPDGYAVVPVDAGWETFRTFLYCRQLWQWQEEAAPHAVKDALSPAVTA